MDDIPSLERRPGGSVEPMSRAAAIKSQFRIPDPPPGQRFELRDPFAEVTYRANSFEDMARKADRVGAVRFVAIARTASAPRCRRTAVNGTGPSRDWSRCPRRSRAKRQRRMSRQGRQSLRPKPTPSEPRSMPTQRAPPAPLSWKQP